MATTYNGTIGANATVHICENLTPVCGANTFGASVWSTVKPVTCIACATKNERAGYLIAFCDSIHKREVIAEFDKLARVQIYASAYVTLSDGVRWIKFGRKTEAAKFRARAEAIPGAVAMMLEYGKIADVL